MTAVEKFFKDLCDLGFIEYPDDSLIQDRLNLAILCTIIAKQSALIAVDEILNAHLFDLHEKEYWIQVKEEIEKL